MIVTYQFSCAYPGCKVFVLATLHMHDDHKLDLEKLGEAVGFRRYDDSSFVIDNRWKCLTHQTETKVST